MSSVRKILYAVAGVWVGGIVLFVILFGVAAHKAPEVASSVFSPTNEFKLDTWFKLGPIAFNKGVLYLLLAAGITIGVMTYIAKRLQQRPGRLQVAVESFYDFTRNMTRENFDKRMERKVLPADRDDLHLHPRLEPDRLHPATGQLDREVQHLRRAPTRRSRSTRPIPTSPSRWCSRWGCSCCSSTRASNTMDRSVI